MTSKKPKTQPAQGRAEVTRRQFVATVGGAAGAVAFNQQLLAAGGRVAPAGTETTAAEIREPKNAAATNLTINGRPYSVSIDPRVTLLDLLRENLGLTATKKGCDHGQCGACTVLVQGVRINSRLAFAVTLDGENVTTIEGLSPSGRLHPLQAAFLEHDGLQCGYCTPGQICSAVGLLREAENGHGRAAAQSAAEAKSEPI